MEQHTSTNKNKFSWTCFLTTYSKTTKIYGHGFLTPYGHLWNIIQIWQLWFIFLGSLETIFGLLAKLFRTSLYINHATKTDTTKNISHRYTCNDPIKKIVDTTNPESPLYSSINSTCMVNGHYSIDVTTYGCIGKYFLMHKESISSTFYARLFHTKANWASFL